MTNKTIPGIDGELEVSWVNKPPAPTAGGDDAGASSKEQQQGTEEEDEAMPDAEKGDTAERSKAQDTRRDSSAARDRLDMDYEVADEEGEWGIS